MFKFVIKISLMTMVLLWGGSQVVLSEDMEDRFIDPDLSTSKTILIDVKDASLINVLKIISEQSNLSFIADEDVADKKVTLYLNKVPLNQALHTVLDANGLTYEMQTDSNVFVVKAKFKTEKTKITKVYQLKYATVNSSKLNSTLSSGGGGASSSSSGGAAVPAAGASSGSASTGGLEEALKDALSPDGKVIEDSRTNSLIITDVPGQFDIIESTIAKLDVPIPQILIEVEMLDVSKSTADSLGITYGSNPLSFVGGGVKPTNFPFGPNANSSGGTSTSSSTAAATSTTGWSAAGLTAQLNFISSITDSRTLARPRILTLNNQTAKIEISSDQAISLQSLSSSTSGGSSSNSITPERYTTGVILTVTPQANLSTREITMAVSPKVIDVILSQVQPSGAAAQNGQIYDPETRGSDSLLKLKDGQSMVIGGLLRDEKNKVTTKLPILGDLPVIGAAFRSVVTKDTERELIIFLTPHIIDDTDQMALKGGISPISAQATLDLKDATDRAEEVNSSLNSYDTK